MTTKVTLRYRDSLSEAVVEASGMQGIIGVIREEDCRDVLRLEAGAFLIRESSVYFDASSGPFRRVVQLYR